MLYVINETNPLLTCPFCQLEMLFKLKTAGRAGVKWVRPAVEEAIYLPLAMTNQGLNSQVAERIEMGLGNNIRMPVCTCISKPSIGFQLQFKPSFPPVFLHRKATTGLNPNF